MRILATIMLAATIASSLASCSFSTAEWRAANQSCAAEWKAKIPGNWQDRVVQRTKHVDVPDGNITCRTGLSRDTPECTQGTTSISIPYTEVISVDLNAGRRNREIAQCTAIQCTNSYGNPDCKPGGS